MESRTLALLQAIARRLALGAAGAACLGAAARADPACLPLPGPPALVSAIDARAEPVLADGRVILAPDLTLPVDPSDRPAFLAQARAALSAWLVGRSVTLAQVEPRPDRWGRTIARMFLPPPTQGAAPLWVDRQLVALGLARVAPSLDAGVCVDRLLQAEAQARAEGLGLWRDPAYAILPGARAAAFTGRAGAFVIAQGRIVSLGETGSRAYLNFGPRRRRDLALIVPKVDWRRFGGAGRLLADYVGRTVRARGDLDLWFGPRIEIDTPAQIEIVAAPAHETGAGAGNAAEDP